MLYFVAVVVVTVVVVVVVVVVTVVAVGHSCGHLRKDCLRLYAIDVSLMACSEGYPMDYVS